MARFALLFSLAFFMAFALLKNWKRPFFITMIFIFGISAYFYSTMKKIEDEAKIIPTIKSIETVRILYSSDKKTLFNDPEFREMLKKKYGIVPEGTKLESSEIPKDLSGYDGVWLSQHAEVKDQKSKDIFQTSLVLYSWHEIVKALMREGIVEKKGERYVVAKPEKLKSLEQQGRTYESVGLSGRYEKIRVMSADANTDESLLFDRYIKQGELSYPLITADENLIIELYQTQPTYREKIRKEVVVLMFNPPILVPHSFIAISLAGKKMINILEKPDIRQFISRKYGLRFNDGELDKEAAKELGLPVRYNE